MSIDGGRRLIWVPIIHTAVDLGSLQGAVRRIHELRSTSVPWQDRIRQIGQFWRSIRGALLRLELDWSQVQLYQDGLPVCGKEERIVKELAQAGSANHRLLLELMARGAKLIGTESPDLLVEEYELSRQLLVDASPDAEVANLSRDLLDRRDSFIVSRIDETLPPSRIGCLFLGLLHSLERRLPEDIAVTRMEGLERK